VIFINFQHGKMPKETVDQCETRKEANALLCEYFMVGGGRYWISSRPCANWRQ
jgi:hypothetical protein